MKTKVKKVQQKEGSIVVTTTILQNKEVMSKKEDRKKIKIRPFVTSTANMGVGLGLTIPQGDWSSARIDVRVNMPCYVEEAVDALNQCYALADKFLSEKTKEVKGGE